MLLLMAATLKGFRGCPLLLLIGWSFQENRTATAKRRVKKSQVSQPMLLGKGILTNAFGVDVQQVGGLMQFRFLLGHYRPCQDHAGPALRQVSGEALPECLVAPETVARVWLAHASTLSS